MGMLEILGSIAAIITILGGIIAVTKWGRNLYKKIWRFFTRYRPKIPKETLRLIPQDDSWWSLGTSKSKPAMQLSCDLYITNISYVDVLICKVGLHKQKIMGGILVRHPQRDIYGNYKIPPGCTTEASVDFWIQPPICKEDEPLIADIDIVDQFGNSHRVRKVKFLPRPKKKEEQTHTQMETVSDISNSVEKEIVAVLQAEISRYKDCGRRVGGLGSIKTTYQGRSYCGVGTEWRKTDSPELQAIVLDPESANIESDNASVLIRLFSTLNDQEKKVFVESLLERLSRETPYAPVGYFILFVLYRTGHLKNVLEQAKKKLQSDSAYGFSDFLRLLDGLLRYEYPNFSTEMLDNIEQFLKGIKEHTFGISERLSAIRAFLLSKRIEKGN
jgi:hypothetical protein